MATKQEWKYDSDGRVHKVSEMFHLPALAGLRDRVNVVAVADPDEHRRRRLAGQFDVPQQFTDIESMLADAGPMDAVAVCTPAGGHADVAIAALAAGKHVL